ncbi:MAG TPA: winged helix-turn-helix domain-containing protein [Solirubrobacterales bacterium]|jgi:DNA-binding transcriptional ArsR family regulator
MERPKGILALAAAISHPMRLRIIEATMSPRRRISPTDLAEEVGESVPYVAYHFRELAALGYLKLVDEEKVRGTIKHYYEPTGRAVAWEPMWKRMPPIFKQHLAAWSLKMGVEAFGASIDEGRFESRDDAVVAQDTMRLDGRGADEALAVMLDALNALVRINDEAEARLDESEDEEILISYLMIGSEGALRPI